MKRKEKKSSPLFLILTDVSIAIYMDTWQRSVESQKRTKRQGNAINAIKWDILPKTAGINSQ